MQLEEERRLCYVGMTRARKRLYMLRAFKRGFRGGGLPALPSQFLDELPPSHIRGRAPNRRDPLALRRAAAVPLPAPATPRETFAAGDRVRHSVFGEGVVVAAAPSHGDLELTVAFTGKGVKRLMQSFARLERAATR
jgi:DNA helicase-2/ATP-dependent DNA helicase PcrA